MAKYRLAVMLVLVVTSSDAASKLKFALLPETFDLKDTMIGIADVGAEAKSAQECVDLVVAADPTALAISFDSTTGACKYSTSIYSYKTRSADEEPDFYLRVDNAMKDLSASDCLTEQDAEYVIAISSFGDEQCVGPTYDSVSGLCLSTSGSYVFGRYTAGRIRRPDGAEDFYTFSRDTAIESVNYECESDDLYKAEFGGAWYCYDILTAVSGSTALIKDNQCEVSLGSGWGPVKISERREYGYVRDFAGDGSNVYTGRSYVGLYRQVGTPFVWYDGSAAEDVPWQGSQPNGGDANNMAYVNFDTSVRNDDGTGIQSLICKTPATNTAYDPMIAYAIFRWVKDAMEAKERTDLTTCTTWAEACSASICARLCGMDGTTNLFRKNITTNWCLKRAAPWSESSCLWKKGEISSGPPEPQSPVGSIAPESQETVSSSVYVLPDDDLNEDFGFIPAENDDL